MAGILQHLRSSTLDKRPNPASMVDGQVAINYASGAPGMFFKNSNGDLVKVGPVHVGSSAPNASPASGGTAGNSIGEQWLDNSGGTYVFKVWDGSAWRSEAGEFVNATGDTMTGALILPSGTAAAPALGVGSTDNGLYSPGTYQVALSTNGTGRLFVDANGNVGVNTATLGSNAKFEIKSTTGAINSATARLNSSDTTTGAVDTGSTLLFSGHDGSVSGRDYASVFGAKENSTVGNYASYLAFGTRANGAAVSEKLRITSAGLVGIGTSSPGSLNSTANQLVVGSGTGNQGLTIFAGSSSDSNIFFADGTAGTAPTIGYIQYRHASDRFDFGTNDTTRMTIDSSGRVGIGTTSPSNLLDVACAEGDGIRIGASSAGFITRESEGLRITGASTTRNISFVTSGTEAMRVDTSGRLLVGTSSSSDSVSVVIQGNSGNAAANGSLNLARGTSAPANGAVLGEIKFSDSNHLKSASVLGERDGGTWTSGSSQPSRLVFSTTANGTSSPTERWRINSSGSLVGVAGSAFVAPYVYNTTTATAANVNVDVAGFLRRSTSSIKYKTNVETIEDQYADAILGCRPVWYQSTCEADKPEWGHWGFIAEEVAAIDPRLCLFKEEEDGTLEPEGVQYDRFVPHLLNLIKRQGEAIADLQAEVAALKAQ